MVRSFPMLYPFKRFRVFLSHAVNHMKPNTHGVKAIPVGNVNVDAATYLPCKFAEGRREVYRTKDDAGELSFRKTIGEPARIDPRCPDHFKGAGCTPSFRDICSFKEARP